MFSRKILDVVGTIHVGLYACATMFVLMIAFLLECFDCDCKPFDKLAWRLEEAFYSTCKKYGWEISDDV